MTRISTACGTFFVGALVLAGGALQRRLRGAFAKEFGVPPSRFFTLWALAEAHHRFSTGSGYVMS